MQDADKGLAKGHLDFDLEGEKLHQFQGALRSVLLGANAG